MAVVPWKPNTQGDTSVHNPTIRFSHSSQTANAANAAIARIAITRPERVAFWEIFPAAKPNIHGETNRIAPRTRLATSHNFALVQSFMTHPPLKICQRKLTGDRPFGFHGNGTFGETMGRAHQPVRGAALTRGGTGVRPPARGGSPRARSRAGGVLEDRRFEVADTHRYFFVIL